MMREVQRVEGARFQERETVQTLIFYDGGNPEELRDLQKLAQSQGEFVAGVTTNPTTIAAYLKEKFGKDFRVSQAEAVNFQKDVVRQICQIVNGPISAEVYANKTTTADEMIKQAQEIASWHPNVVVKVPITEPGLETTFKLKKLGIKTNNTLVFSQEQAVVVCLIDRLTGSKSLTIISPFIGRLDDTGVRGIDLVENIMRMKRQYGFTPKILEASVRNTDHIRRGNEIGVDFITSPARVLDEWFLLPEEERIKEATINQALAPIRYQEIPQRILEVTSFPRLMNLIRSRQLSIAHPLTDKGLERFASDWNSIIS